MPRTIIHLDLDAFFCAVEENLNPELRGVAFAVGGQPDARGVVASCSYPARKYGIRSAMPMARAVRLCPDLVIVPNRHGEYGRVSRQVMRYLHDLTPLVEQISIDEAFMDVTGYHHDGYTLAARLQQQINTDLGLPASLGVASNKLVAKIANTVGKAEASQRTDGPPNAIKVVPAGKEADFLAPLDIRELWGVGPKTAERLHGMGIRTIGDIARRDAAHLRYHFGKHGIDLHRRAQGIDERPVTLEHEAKSISKETTFARDERDAEALRRILRSLSDGVGLRLRREGLQGTTIKIKLRWADFTTLTRQMTLPQPIDSDDAIYDAALALFEREWPKGRPVRLIGVGISGFDTPARQLGLWDAPHTEQNRRLQDTLDTLKDRFGENSIRRGSTVRRKSDTPEDDTP
ncbi:MAG: DNA polymerase IV [Chloroflexota bacterium]